MEGECENPEKVFIDLIVRGEQAKAVLRKYKNDFPKFNDKDKPTWFASIKIGSVEAKPYLSNDGKAKATLAARLIKFTYLKIGDQVIDLENLDAKAPAEANETNVEETEVKEAEVKAA